MRFSAHGFWSACLTLAWLFMVEASITIMDTNQVLKSWEDTQLGHRLWKGYEYMGRLQYIEGNLQLCSSDASTFTVTPTTDGLPVALYAKAGGCSLEEKALVASTLIRPANTVAYLIVDDRASRKKQQEETEETAVSQQFVDSNTDEDLLWDTLDASNILEIKERNTEDESILEASASDDETIEIPSMTFVQPEKQTLFWPLTLSFDNSDDDDDDKKVEDRRFLKHHRDDSRITVAILHVSSRSGYELLDLLLKESNEIKNAGGPKLLLNSKTPGATMKTLFVWGMFGFVIMASCSLCILALSTPDEEAQAPQRPRPRRLTQMQVREKFPAFHYEPEQHVEQPLDDECAICLDDFDAGTRLRQLPCGHTFHSTCIARWLIERSAVCPLCKADYYEEEPEEEEEEENMDETTSPPPTPLEQLWSWLAARDTVQVVEEPTAATEGGMPTAPPARAFRWPFSAEEQGGERRRWRSWLARRSSATTEPGLQTELTEPLLETTTEVETPQQETSTAEVPDQVASAAPSASAEDEV